jgi:hypothetical protein
MMKLFELKSTKTIRALELNIDVLNIKLEAVLDHSSLNFDIMTELLRSVPSSYDYTINRGIQGHNRIDNQAVVEINKLAK